MGASDPLGGMLLLLSQLWAASGSFVLLDGVEMYFLGSWCGSGEPVPALAQLQSPWRGTVTHLKPREGAVCCLLRVTQQEVSLKADFPSPSFELCPGSPSLQQVLNNL